MHHPTTTRQRTTIRSAAIAALGSALALACSPIAAAQSHGDQPADVTETTTPTDPTPAPTTDTARPTLPPVEGRTPAFPAADKESSLGFSLRGFTEYNFKASLNGGGGDVAIFRAGFGTALSWDAAEDLTLRFATDYEFSNYDFTDSAGIVDGVTESEPFDDFNRISISANLSYDIKPDVSLFVGGGAVSAFENNADVSDSWSGAAFAGVRFFFSENFILGLGAGGASQLEDNPLFIPLIYIYWKINDNLLFETETGERVRSGIGAGLRLSYLFDDNLSTYIRGGVNRREYRLNDDFSTTAGGSLRDTRLTLGLGVNWQPIPGFVLDAEVGIVAYQEFEFHASGKRQIGERNTDPTGYLGILLSYQF